MKNQWYCGVEGQQYGPYTWEQMRAMAEEGRLVAESYVRREVDQQWMTAAQVPSLLKKKSRPAASTTSTQVPVAGVKKAKAASSTAISVPIAPVVASTAGNGHSANCGNRPAPVRAVPIAADSGADLPVGMVVDTPAAPPPASVPTGVPIGFAVQTSPPAKKPKFQTAVSDGEASPKKKNNTLLIVGILCGVVLLVGVTGVGLLIWSGMRAARAAIKKIDNQIQAEVQAANVPPAGEANPVEINPVQINPPAGEANPTVPTAPPAETDPLTPPPPSAAAVPSAAVAAAPTATPPVASTPTMPPAEAAAAAKVVKSAGPWSDVTRTGGVKLLEISLAVNSVWLAADEAGTRIEPANGAASGAKYVFVELKLTNSAKAARPFTSWNATAGTTAVLADMAGQPLAFVPPSATPSANRLGKVEIPAGKTQNDTLVFRAPSGSIDKLRLALAKSALAGTAKTRGTHFAFEIPQEMLLRGGPRTRPDPAAQPAVTPSGDNPPPPDLTAPPLNTPPAAAAPMPAAPPAAEPKFDPAALDKEIQKGNEPAKGDAAPKSELPKADVPAADAQPAAPEAMPKKGKVGKAPKVPSKTPRK